MRDSRQERNLKFFGEFGNGVRWAMIFREMSSVQNTTKASAGSCPFIGRAGNESFGAGLSWEDGQPMFR